MNGQGRLWNTKRLLSDSANLLRRPVESKADLGRSAQHSRLPKRKSHERSRQSGPSLLRVICNAYFTDDGTE
jgi:hypothetical protein